MSDREKPREATEDRFAANLRTVREDRGMSQAEAARQMAARGFGFTQPTMYKIEHRERRVSIGEAQALAEVLMTSIDRLTWPTREASAVELLCTYAVRARRSYEQIVVSAVALYAAGRQLDRTIAETARWDSPRVQDARAEAIAARGLSPDGALRQAREETAEMLAGTHDHREDVAL